MRKYRMMLMAGFCVLAGSMVAQNGPGAGAPQGAPPAGGGEQSQSKGVMLKPDKMIAELDTNHDSCVSKQEWTGAGLPEAIFSTLEGQAVKRDCVTATEFTKGPAPAGIDADGDGYLSVAEMRNYVKNHGTEPR